MKNFFSYFDIDVYALLDSDILFEGFDLLETNEETKKARQIFLERLDAFIRDKEIKPDISREKVKELTRRLTWIEKYNCLKGICEKVKSGISITEEDFLTIDYLFAVEIQDQRRTALKRIGLIEEYRNLLSMLREQNIFVLSQGCVEDYYPENVIGSDKPSKAFDACIKVNTAEIAKSLCPRLPTESGDTSEFECILGKIFI